MTDQGDRYIHFSKGYKYWLRQTYRQRISIHPGQTIQTPFIELTHDGWLTIKRGYAWDGASGPTWDDSTNMRGSLVHDALAQLIRMGHLPRTMYHRTNLLFRRMCRADGMNPIRAQLYFIGVDTRLARKIATGKPRKILVAPKKKKSRKRILINT